MRNTNEVIVHCGLHKTGTTAIQSGLPMQFDACLNAGIYLHNGNNGTVADHNLAATLSQNPKKSRDELKRLIGDIRYYNKPKSFISSEDFQSILTSPRCIRRLTRILKMSGAEKVTYLVYLRNPIEYITSLYLTLLIFKHATPFSHYLNEIIEDGHYEYGKWKFHFDYSEISFVIEQADADLVFRDYHSLKYKSSVSDVLDFLGAPENSIESAASMQLGLSRRKRSFTLYCRNTFGKKNTDRRMFKDFEARLSSSKLFLPVKYKERILERFATALIKTDRRYGTSIFSATKSDVLTSQSKKTGQHEISYLDVFNENARSDLSLILERLSTPERSEVSKMIMGYWGW